MNAFTRRVVDLYKTLDFKLDSEVEATRRLGMSEGDAVQLFVRSEGASTTRELIWILGDPASHLTAYSRWSELSRSVPWFGNGVVRTRLVAKSSDDFSEFEDSLVHMYRRREEILQGVPRYSWMSLLNDLFGSDRFCLKTEENYRNYRDSLSVQLRGLTNVPNAVWTYSPQTLKTANGGRISSEMLVDRLADTSIEKPKLFVVHAPASLGKTAFSYASTQNLVDRHNSDNSSPFPIFIPFAQYRRFGGVLDILRSEIEAHQLYGVNSTALLHLIHWGRAVVVLDGFDEMIAELGRVSARENLRALRQFLSGSARLLLTTRTAFLSTNAEVLELLDADDPDEVEILELEPFDREGRKAYLSGIGFTSVEVQETIDYLDSFPTWPSSVASPLLLNTVASLSKVPSDSPPTLGKLYDSHVDILCARERDRQQHTLSNGLQVDILTQLALSMYDDGVFQYDRGILELFWDETSELLLQAGVQPGDIDGLRAKVLSHALLNSAHSGDPLATGHQIGFIHPSFRDHFVASHIRHSLQNNPTVVTDRIRASLARAVSSDLADMLAYWVEDLDQYLKVILEDVHSGFANAISVLMASIRQGILDSIEAEKVLAQAIGVSKVIRADLSNIRLEQLQFDGWTFESCNFNEAQLVRCRFKNCNFERTSMYGTTIIDTVLDGSDFGDANLVNSLGVVQGDIVDRMYDNGQIRLWLLSQNAKVKSDDLMIATDAEMPVNDLVEHIFRRFYPKGSDAQQRHVLTTSLTKSLPPHRISEVNSLVSWLMRRGVLVDGPPLRRLKTWEISRVWRDDVTAWMREDRMSDQLQELIEQSLNR